MGQLSFWSADARPRALGDLEGLLCGPGRAELFGRGSAARLTVVLGPPPRTDEDDGNEGDGNEGDGDGNEGDGDGHEGDDGHEVDGADGADETDASIDPDELAFLDLDPDEIAARLGREPGSGVSPPRGRGPIGVLPSSRRQARQPSRMVRTPVCAHPEDDPVTTWRVRAVCCALRARGLPAQVGRAGDGRPQVRTAFRSDLVDLARAWTCGEGMKTVPAGFDLDGPRLRLWVLAAGAHAGRAYRLGLDPDARRLEDRLLTASRHLGLGARLAGDSRGPALRIVGARRQGRLAELVGHPPRELADGVWPV